MNKKILAIAIPVVIVVLLGIISAKPNNVSGPNTDAAPAKKTINTANMSVALASADKVEVFVFHRTQRCISCITMGKFAEKTVVERFGKELQDGRIEFREINVDDPQNEALSAKFHAAGSSLFTNAIRGETEDIQEDIAAWRLLGDESAFKNYLANKINVLLGKQ